MCTSNRKRRSRARFMRVRLTINGWICEQRELIPARRGDDEDLYVHKLDLHFGCMSNRGLSTHPRGDSSRAHLLGSAVLQNQALPKV